jgi:hypothetical protein
MDEDETPQKIPTFEEVQRDLGMDKMSFMSEMLQPDEEEEE